MRNLRKGISLIVLIITILVITILASIMIPSGIDKITSARLASFNSDITELKEEIDSYMALNNLEYPVKTDASGSYAIYSINTSSKLLAEATKKGDENDTFYIIDLQKLKVDNTDQGVGATIDDYYIVAKTSRNVYYAKGIKIGDLVYYTKRNKGDGLVAVVPTSAATPTNTPTLTPTPTPGGPTPTPTNSPTPTNTPTPIPSYSYNNPKIPNGFSYVSGTWDNGFTIQDSNSNGNQFVWVPVGDFTLGARNISLRFERTAFEGETFDASNYHEADDIANITNSVNTNGGFYIAKYEASNNVGKAESKVDKAPWTNITWDAAKTAAEEMDAGWDTSVESVLCYGAHWDTTLQWLIQSGAKSIEEVTINSTTWGNYYNATFTYGAGSTTKAASSATKINTGVSTTPVNRHMVKGIYDLAGNVWEWTMENSTISNRASRGGHYANILSNYPAVERSNYAPSNVTAGLGFRSVLYLK